jgi:hypothetical protein
MDDLGLQATLSWFCRRIQTIDSQIQLEPEIDVEEGDDHLSILASAERRIASRREQSATRIVWVSEWVSVTANTQGRGQKCYGY